MKIVITLASLILLLLQSSCTTPIPSIQEFNAAASKFNQEKSNTNVNQKMPRIADKKIRSIFNILTESRILTEKSYTTQNIETQLNICGKANEVTISYILFGLKNQDSQSTDQTAMATQVQMLAMKNTIIFQDEISTLIPFQIRCMATTIPQISKHLESLPPQELTDVRRQGALQFRNGLFGIIYGALTSVQDQNITEINRLRVLKALSDTATVYANALPSYSRKLIGDVANAAIQSAPQNLREPLFNINAAMTNASCSTLCKF